MKTTNGTFLVAAAAAFSMLVGLAGCAENTAPTMTLLDTKAQVQLLRNGVAARVPAEQVQSVELNADQPSECGDGDPYLSWGSSVLLDLVTTEPLEADAVFESLVKSFVAEGWVASRPNDKGTSLTNTSAFSKITVQLQDRSTQPKVSIDVVGPCVLTDGIASDEIGRLVGLG